LESFALVACSKQVPAELALSVTVEVSPESAHPAAVPPKEIAYEITPVPEPPDGVNTSDVEYGKVFDVTDEEKLKLDCIDFPI